MNTGKIRRRMPIVAMAVAAVVAVPIVADAQGGNSAKAIEGSWQFTITRESPPTPLPTKGLITFAPGGGVVTVDQRAVAVPGKVTAGIGQWERTRPGVVRLRFAEFLSDPQGRVLTLTLRGTIELDDDGDAFVGSGAFQATDAAGNVVFGGTNAIRGVRMTAT